ncbi:MAG: MFS transporter, partial [Vulcanimicrobiaceae bacterium]
MSMLAKTPNAWRLGALWFGLQLIWGAVLGVALQSRIDLLVGADALVRFAQIVPLGAFVAAVTQLLVGLLSDRRRARGSSRNEFYIVGVIIALPALWMLMTASTLSMLVIAFVVLQLGANIATGPLQTMIAEYIPSQRYGAASAAMGALQSLGNAVGAIVASQISDVRIVAGCMMLALVASAFVTILHVRTLTPCEVATVDDSPIARDRGVLFLSRALLYLGLYSLLGYAYFFIRNALHLTAITSTRASGMMLLAFTIGGALGAVLAGRPADRLDRRVPALVGGALATVSLAGMALWVSSVQGAWACAGVAGIGWGGLLVADWAIATRLLPPTVRATAMGV